MTRKHFKALADALAATRPDPTFLPERDQWETTRDAVASTCRSFNPNFDRARFLAACNGEG